MRDASDGPVCPECGEPIGQTATYCMHCSTDLTEERNAADANENGVWDGAEIEPRAGSTSGDPDAASPGGGNGVVGDVGRWTGTGGRSVDRSAGLLDPDGLVDNSLTVVVGIAGGLVVGIVGTVVLAAVTGSGIGLLFGVAAWLGATAYLVRRRTVQAAVSGSGYAVAAVLLLVPFVAVSPVVEVEGGIEGRVTGFLVLLVFVAVPAGVAAGVGYVAAQFVPDGTDEPSG